MSNYMSRKTAVAKGGLAAFAALCAIYAGHGLFAEGSQIQSANDAEFPFLADTPLVSITEEMQSGSQPDEVRAPQWRGVASNVKYAAIQAFDKHAGDDVQYNASRAWGRGVVGKPLEFSVKILASNIPASSVDTTKGNGKSRNWQLVPAQELAPAKSIVPVISAGSHSQVQATLDSNGVMRVKVPAVVDDAQTAWIYPQSVARYPNGAWQVKVAVGAVSQKELDLYQARDDKGGWKHAQGIGAFFLAFGLLIYAAGVRGTYKIDAQRSARDEWNKRGSRVPDSFEHSGFRVSVANVEVSVSVKKTRSKM